MYLKKMNNKYRIIAIALLFICSVNQSFSQNESKFLVTSGLSIIDDNFTTNYNPVDVSEHWHFGYYLGMEYALSKGVSFSLSYSFNAYEEGKQVDGSLLEEDSEFHFINLKMGYRFQEVLNLNPAIDPFAFIGIGNINLYDEDRFVFNLGLGLRYWIPITIARRLYSRKLAIEVSSSGILNYEIPDYGRQIQHQLGIIYSIN